MQIDLDAGTFAPVITEIENSVPIPEHRRRASPEVLRGLGELGVGQSRVFCNLDKHRLRNACLLILGKGGFVMRTAEGGIRIWRIEKCEP